MQSNPMNYKTKDGLSKALKRAGKRPMTVKLAWWFKTAEYALVNKWGWTEEDAAELVCRRMHGK